MLKFVIGIVVGAVALAYYPMYIDDVKQVTNDAAKVVVEVTEEKSLLDQAKDLAK
jgi:hypothetical protein